MKVKDFYAVHDDAWLEIIDQVKDDDRVIYADYEEETTDKPSEEIMEREVEFICAYDFEEEVGKASIGDICFVVYTVMGI